MTAPASSAQALSHRDAVTWRNAIFVMFAVSGIGYASWLSRLPAVRDGLAASTAEMGLLVFAGAAGAIGGLGLSSHVIARIGSRSTITAGLIASALAAAITGIGATSGSFLVTALALAASGAFSGMADVACNVSGAANERVLGRSVMPIFHAFFSFGTMLGAAGGAVAELAGLPVAVHLGIVALACILAVALCTRFVQPEQAAEPPGSEYQASTWRDRLAIWRDSRTLLIGLLVLAAAFAEGSANDWLALAMVDGHGVDNATGALVLGVFVTAMTVSRLGGVVLLNRFGRVPVLRASFLLAAAGLLTLIFAPDPIIATLGAVAWGLGSALGFPVGMSAAADDPKTAAARVSAVATIGYIAFLGGPPLIGFLGDRFGLLSALLVVLVLAAVGATVAGSARETGR